MIRIIGYCLLLSALILSANSYADFVECPSTSAFASCLSCWKSTKNSPIQCVCPNYQFAVADRCFTAYYPCDKSYMDYIYNPKYPQFNIWNSTIQPFWEKKFAEAQTNTTPPNPLPTILNNYNFSSMNLTLMRGWTEAYYLYLAYQNQTTSWNSSKKYSILYEAVSLAQSMLGLKVLEKWYKMGNMTNSKLNKTLVYEDFFQFLRLRIKLLIPCHTCKEMYGPITIDNNFTCTKCPPDCKNCSKNASVCGGCLYGNYLTAQSLCKACPIGDCAICTQNQCTQCFGSKTIDGGICSPCNGQIGCSYCQNQQPDICLQCNGLQYSLSPNAQGKCYQCIQTQCSVCNENNTAICQQCSSGYYIDSAGLCQSCPDNCIQCSSQKCLRCDYGYGLIDGACGVCQWSGCAQCNQDLSICTGCFAPHFQFGTKNQTCYLTKFTTSVGNYLYETAQCRPGCDYCYDNNTDLCYSCHQRYYIEDRRCKKCMPGCLQCQSASTCRLCVSGYTLSNFVCIRCPENCRLCNQTNSSQCLDCRVGYYSDGSVCKPSLQAQCFLFDVKDNNLCLACMPGYALTSDHKCIQCQINCQSSCNPKNISECRKSRFEEIAKITYKHSFQYEGCDFQANGNCLIPEQGWQLYYENQNMIKVRWDCLYPCKTCNTTYCYTCEPGYIYSNGACSLDLSCNPNCTQCVPGSERNGTTNSCIKCPVANCGACLNGTCLQCLEGFYLQGQTCRSCPIKCARCYDGTNCNTCASGYLWPLQMYQYAYDCVKCSDNCKTCKFEPVLCTQCYPGMKLANFRCINQYYVAFRYIFDIDYTQFITNMKTETLIAEIIAFTKANYSEIFIKNITSGSTIVDGIVSAFNSTRASQIYSQLKSSTIQSFPVKGSSFSYMNQTVVVKCISTGGAGCPAGTEESKVNVGMIVGIVIGAVAFIALLIVLIVCIRKRRRSTKTDGDIEIQSNSVSASKSSQYQNVSPTSATDLSKKI